MSGPLDVMRAAAGCLGSPEFRLQAAWTYAGRMYADVIEADPEAEAECAAAEVLWAELVLAAVEEYAAAIGSGDDVTVPEAFAAGFTANVDVLLSMPEGYGEAEWASFVAGFAEALRGCLASAEAALPWDAAGLGVTV